MNIMVEKLRLRVDELRAEGRNNAIIINALKEELHYLLLNFIYNEPKYAHLIMYGGTLLRMVYKLQRMSEDLDFQTDTKFDFGKFRDDLIAHCKSTYGLDVEVDIKSERMGSTDYAFVKFPHILGELGLKGGFTVLKIRFDVNRLESASKFMKEAIPITRDTFVFSIKTYHLATLMASKVGAVLLRTQRGIGDGEAGCKPRDIYDLEWYMHRKIIPNLEYLKAVFGRAGKTLEAKNVLELFDQLMLRVVNLDDALFERDLATFFYDPTELDQWLINWKERLIAVRKEYDIFKVKQLHQIYIKKDFSTDTRYFHFWFETEPAMLVKITVALSDYWYMFSDFKIAPGHRRRKIEPLIVKSENLTDLDYEYLGLFYAKIEDYLKRNDSIVLQDEIKTKLIRANADNLNIKSQIWLDRKLLESVHFEDLL